MDNHERKKQTLNDEENKEKKAVLKEYNVLSAYLHQIRKWPILNRTQERNLAKNFAEAQNDKRLLTEKWVNLLAQCLDWRKVHSSMKKVKSSGCVKEVQHQLIADIEVIKNIRKDITACDRMLEDSTLSHYRKKKITHAKSNLVMRMHEETGKIDLIRYYRTGAVQKLRTFMKKASRPGIRRKFLALIRSYVRVVRNAKESKDALVNANLRLVVGIAKKHTNRGIALSDLIQDGNIGLMRAIEKFDYRLGNRLSTYASWWIRQTIIRSIEDRSSLIRVPVYINEKIKKLLKNSVDTQHESTVEDASAQEQEDETGNIYRALQVVKDPISLEASYGEDGSNLHECIPDMMPPSPMDQVLQCQLYEITEDILKSLPPRDERVLRLRFGLGFESEHTLEEIGDQFGISRERIRQIETSALRKIRALKNTESLLPFLEYTVNEMP